MHASIGEVTDLPTGKQVVLGYTIEIEGQAKPACVAEMVVLLLPWPGQSRVGSPRPERQLMRSMSSGDGVYGVPCGAMS